MRRDLIAGAILLGATVPAAAVLYLFGCCVLPLHDVLHRAMPACHLGVQLMAAGNDEQERVPATPAAPDRERSAASAIRALIESRAYPASLVLVAATDSVSAAADRNFVTLGGVRCDDDVGLQTRLMTFRI
ncbi:MAG TPA: hypothetical protein VMT00_04355 [Thermoanaerobaculia bacterium]|nr:hypothetical protein [Thermoanaerobaculia bacterium]